MSKLKVAIVGCGGIANQKHMPSLKTQADKAEMVAFCDIIKERAEKAAKEYGTPDAKVYTDYKEMLADKDVEIDVVHVCTPNVAHCPITVAAFEAGKHVMCENQWHIVQKMHRRCLMHGRNPERNSQSVIRIV